MTTPSSPVAYFPHVDVLRALAVLAVLTYHLDARALPGGFAGVDVFFVISGFVVCHSVFARASGSFKALAVAFVARRLRRIAPPLFVCLTVVSLASALWIPPSWLSDDIPRTGRYAFFGVGNVLLAKGDNGYFSPRAEFNPFTHTWSLGVEEQFYLLFPLLLWLWLLGGRARVLCLALLVATSAASFAFALSMHAKGRPEGYYLLSTRFWELGVGVFLSLALRHEADVSTVGRFSGVTVRWGGSAVAFALLVWTFTWSGSTESAFHASVISAIATAILIAAFHQRAPSATDTLPVLVRPLIYLGRMSYSLYLWHWPVFVLFRWTVGLSGIGACVGAVGLSFALAWLSFRWVERPFRAGSFANERGVHAIAATFVMALTGATLVRGMELYRASFSFSTVSRHQDDWYPSKRQRLVNDRGCTVAPEYLGGDAGKHIVYRASCEGVARGPRVFAAGDSHARAYGPAFAAYALHTGAEVVVYTHAGCPLVSLQPWREAAETCRAQSNASLSSLEAGLGRGDVVFLPSLRLPRFVDQWATLPMADGQVASDRTADETRDEARAVIRRIRSTGAKVVLPLPTPILKAPPFRCVDWWTQSNEICAGGMAIDRDEFLALRAPVVQALKELAEGDDGVTLFDPGEALCPPAKECSAFLNGRPLFFDGDHLSAYGNEVLMPHFTAAMKRAVASE